MRQGPAWLWKTLSPYFLALFGAQDSTSTLEGKQKWSESMGWFTGTPLPQHLCQLLLASEGNRMSWLSTPSNNKYFFGTYYVLVLGAQNPGVQSAQADGEAYSPTHMYSHKFSSLPSSPQRVTTGNPRGGSNKCGKTF